MRIPAWLIVIAGLGSFVLMTALCSLFSYSFVRTAVIDAAEQGVDVPDVVELVDYVLNPPDAAEVFSDEALGVPAAAPTQSPVFALIPTPTPGAAATSTLVAPSQPATTTTPAATQPGAPGMTQIPLDQFLAGEGTPDASAAPTQVALPADVPRWEDPRRINVLLMGVDQRGDEIFEDRFRTDTMILVQIDPVQPSVGVLSIPRDLWVQIPGFEANRINQANYLGDGPGLDLPGGGPALAMETIRVNFGIPVQYYVQINFDVFIEVVEAAAPNGVEVCINEEIYDPDYPDGGRGTIVVTFEPGCQTLDAERLLQYARTRATQGGDFDRNRRQQEVIQAVQNEVLSVGGVAGLIGSIPTLYNSLSDSYRTNFSLEEILALAGLLGQVSAEDVTYGSINTLHVTLGQNDEGDQILIPNYNAIRQVISQTFDPQPALSLADLRTRAEVEDASIVIINDTTIAGLAGRTRDYLTSRAVDVFEIGSNVPANEATSTLILDYTNNPYTARYLAALLFLPETAIRPGSTTSIQSSADVAIVTGSDMLEVLAGTEPASP